MSMQMHIKCMYISFSHRDIEICDKIVEVIDQQKLYQFPLLSKSKVYNSYVQRVTIIDSVQMVAYPSISQGNK